MHRFAQACQTLDIGILVLQLKTALFQWKKETWPKKFGFWGTAARTKKFGLRTLSSWMNEENEEEEVEKDVDVVSDLDTNDHEGGEQGQGGGRGGGILSLALHGVNSISRKIGRQKSHQDGVGGVQGGGEDESIKSWFSFDTQSRKKK